MRSVKAVRVWRGSVRYGRSRRLRYGLVSYGAMGHGGQGGVSRGTIWRGMARRSRHGRVRWVVAGRSINLNLTKGKYYNGKF